MTLTRLGIIGAGTMGSFHARSAARSGTCELVAVADPRPGKAASVARRFGCTATEDVAAILARTDIDAVIIATPVDAHLGLVEQAARAGLAIFCEKPLAPTLEGCLRARAATEECGVPLQVGFHRRFDPDWRQLHGAVTSGELGQVYLLKSTLRDMTIPPAAYLRASGGYFADAFVHDFDAARWLLGDVETVTAVGTAMTEPFHEFDDFDSAAVVLRLSSGALAIFDGSRVAGYGYDCATELVGSQGTLRIANPPASNIIRLHDGRAESRLPSSYLERFAEAYATEIDDFARVVAEGAPPAVGAWDALLALAVADAARISAQRGRSVALAEVLQTAAVTSQERQ